MLNDIKTNEHYLLHLLSCALDNTSPMEKLEGVSWEDVFKQAERHSVANTACYSVEKLHDKPDDKLWKQWKEVRNKALVKDVTLTAELKQICSVLSDNKIRCLPIKGCRLKELYPRTDMRFMADLDILIDEENAPRVKDLLIADGFKCEHYGTSHHDIYKKYPIVNVEIHRTLMPERMEEIHDYYANGFSHAESVPRNAFVYEMPAEEFYAYHIAHLYKHYEASGSGIRSFMDIYLIRKKYGNSWNEGKVAEILTELGLSEFESKMREVADYWFGEAEPTKECLGNGSYILDSGTYGTIKHSVDKQISKKGRLGYFWSRAFLPYKMMVTLFPVLKKLPILLPVFWLWRLVRALIFSRARVKYQLKAVFKARKNDE